MSKIKSIEINDFRVYQDKQLFSLESELGISNLIVIYAPNGYGKTSFFDAIEWCYSGKISRFENPFLKTEIEKKDYSRGDKILLTNRKSHVHGKVGEIKISTVDGKIVNRIVEPRKINNQDFKFDYRPGIFKSEFDEAEIIKLTKTNILTQDQIDSFLRNTNSEDKFNALKGFWPEGESATLTYKTLTGYLRVVENEKEAIRSRINDITEEIKKLLNTEGHVEAVNTQIVQLSTNTNIDFKMDPLVQPVGADVYLSISDLTQSFIKKAERQIETTQGLKNRLQDLINGFDKYANTLSQIAELSTNLNSMRLLEKKYVDLKASNKLLSELDGAIALYSTSLTVAEQLMQVFDEYSELRKMAFDNETDANRLLSENQSILDELEKNKIDYNQLNISLREIETDFNKVTILLNNVEDYFRQYNHWTKQQKNQDSELSIVETNLEKVEKELSEIYAQQQSLNDILKSLDFQSLKSDYKLIIGSELGNYAALSKSLEVLKLRLEEKHTEYNKSGSFDENLDRMITWGEEYVKAFDIKSCPLCKTGFDTVSELVERIKSEKKGILKITELTDNIRNIEGEVIKIEAEVNASKLKIIDFLSGEVQKYEISLTNLEGQRGTYQRRQQDILSAFYHAKESAANVLELLIAYLPADILIRELDLGEIKGLIQDKLKVLNGTIIENQTFINSIKKLIESNENMLTVNRNKVAAAQNSALLARSNNSYLSAEMLIKSLNFNDSTITKELVTGEIESTNILIKEILTKTEVQKKIIENLVREIADFPLPLSEEQIAGRVIETQNQLKALNESKNSYEVMFFASVETEEIDKKKSEEALKSTELKLTKLSVELSSLNEFAIKVELINENVTKSKLENELIEINNTLPMLDNVYEKILAAENSAAIYIDQEINSYFNKEVINQIYARIEPHPELSYIDFKPEVTDKGPSLSVKAFSTNDDVNPVLYLSAGQLNVLSLSIFLAKVFESSSDYVSTIFMDDPVQNLSDINVLSFIDIIRSMTTTYDKQMVISTHDEHFFKLIKNKMPSASFNTVFYELSNFGKIKSADALLN